MSVQQCAWVVPVPLRSLEDFLFAFPKEQTKRQVYIEMCKPVPFFRSIRQRVLLKFIAKKMVKMELFLFVDGHIVRHRVRRTKFRRRRA
jgi:hypothetical protein